MSWKKQQEDDIHQAKLLNALMKKMTNNFQNVTKYAADMATAFKKSTDAVTKEKTAWRGKEKHDRWKNGYLEKQQKFEENMFSQKINAAAKANKIFTEQREADRKHNKGIADSRNRNRIITEQVHGDNVRHNLKMRQLYKDQSQSLSNVMNLMTGMSGKGAAMGGIKTAFNTLSLGSEILTTNSSLREAKKDKEEGLKANMDKDPSQEAEWKKIIARIIRLEEIKVEQTEKLGMFGKLGGGDEKVENESTWAKRLEPIMAWAKKNKTGIIISAASIGMMFMVFKKLLSVSPMLQKMLEVMSLAFNLILRPFGDFIGFILRPIAMGFLMMVMPFFKKAYPLLMELGTTIGNALANGDLKGVIVAALTAIPPLEVLNVLNPFTENTTAGEVGAAGAALAGTGAGLLYGGYRVHKSMVGRMLRGFGVGQGSTPSGNAFSKTNIDLGEAKGTTRGRPTSWYKPPKQATSGATPNWRSYVAAGGKAPLQITKIARMLAMVSKIARIASPVGLALMGWGGVTSVIKHFDPEMYQAMRDSTEFMGIGREFLGLGEQSDAEQLVGGYNWVKGGLAEWSGQDNSILDPQATFPDNGLNQSGFNGIATPTANGGTHITFNIDKVEKGVDVNMIALQVKAVLETSNTRIN